MSAVMEPQIVDDIQMAFPAQVSHLMPAMGDVPAEFKKWHGTKWNDLFSDCFFSGLKDLDLVCKDGIDRTMAWRHIRTVMGSFEPSHEDKEAACAYLMSLWFESATWTAKSGERKSA